MTHKIMTTIWQVNARDSVVSDIVSELESRKMPFIHTFYVNVRSSGGLYGFWLRGVCIYVGMSEDLQRRIMQHSKAEENPELASLFITYPNEIQVSIAYRNVPVDKLRQLESYAIRKLNPVANRRGI